MVVLPKPCWLIAKQKKLAAKSVRSVESLITVGYLFIPSKITQENTKTRKNPLMLTNSTFPASQKKPIKTH